MQCFESECGKAKIYVENDMPLGVFHDFLMLIKGNMIDRMVQAQKQEVEMNYLEIITKEPDRCGGNACIRNSRIPVWTLINYRRLGGSDTSILYDYPSLTSADLEAASEYYTAYTEEIDLAIRKNEEDDEK